MKYYLLNCTFPHREEYNCDNITSKGAYGLTHQMMLTGNEVKILSKLLSVGGVNNEKWNLDIVSVEKISQQEYERFSKVIHGPCTALIKESIWRYLEATRTPEGYSLEMLNPSLSNQEESKLENNPSQEYCLIDIYYSSVNHEAKQYWFQMMADEQEAELLVSRFGELIASPEFKFHGGESKDFEGVAYTGICEVSREEYDRLNNLLGKYVENCCKEILRVISKCLEKGNKAVDEGKRPWEEQLVKLANQKKLDGNMISENEMEYDDEESRIKKKFKPY